MVRNVVFDLGNVLISFRPAEYLSGNGYSQKKREKILSDIFASREWVLLDEGKISIQEATDSIALKSSLKRDEISQIFADRIKIFYSIDRNIKILPELKKQGFKLYYLSNFHADLFDYVKNNYVFFSYFDGGIISADFKCSKPDPEFYRILLDKYGLIANECFYIDDLEKNVLAAKSIGMIGFTTNCSEDFSQEVKKILHEF
jgi:FMN phosphatase YigB (HAD superfamily)